MYKKEEDFVAHLAKNHPNLPKNKSNICEECGLVVTHWRKMYHHKKLMHDYSQHHCNICSASIQGRFRFRKHVHNHENPRKRKECPECKKIVKDVGRHMGKMHLIRELKPFGCELCEKRFASAKDLRNHAVTHSELRPFVCRFGCGFGSKSAGNRKKHEVNKHKAQLEEDTKCLKDL